MKTVVTFELLNITDDEVEELAAQAEKAWSTRPGATKLEYNKIVHTLTFHFSTPGNTIPEVTRDLSIADRETEKVLKTLKTRYKLLSLTQTPS